jgi:hypothetical protein
MLPEIPPPNSNRIPDGTPLDAKGGYRAMASALGARNLADEEVEAHDREGSHPAVD